MIWLDFGFGGVLAGLAVDLNREIASGATTHQSHLCDEKS